MGQIYRYYDVQYSAEVDEWGGSFGTGRVEVSLMTFEIIKETKCGCWINTGFWLGGPDESPPRECLKFVNMKANKKYACRTIEEAKESFIARKRRQISLLTKQIERAEKALVAIGATKDIFAQQPPKGGTSWL